MTMRAWVEGVAGLSVVGVSKRHLFQPSQINDADLPMSFPRLPEVEQETVTLSGATGLTVRKMEWVFVVRPFMLGTNKAEFIKSLDLVDAIDTTLQAATVTQNVDNWATKWMEESFDGGITGYRVLIVTVTGSE